MNPELLHGILAKAIEQELGLVVETDDPHQLANRLYEYMKANPEFKVLSIAERPARPKELFIKKKSAELDP
jgi:hypothetical protein